MLTWFRCRLLTIPLLIFFPVNTFATMYRPVHLPELIDLSDVIVLAEIVDADGVNAKGKVYTVSGFVSRPRYGNSIRFHINLNNADILCSNKPDLPDRAVVGMDEFRWFSVGAAKDMIGEKYIFFLKGDELGRAASGYWYQFPSSLDEVKAAIKKKKQPEKPKPECN